MNWLLSLVFLSLIAAGTSHPRLESRLESVSVGDNQTIHFYVLLVPDSTVQELKKARQEEAAEGITDVSQTGVYVAQIIAGVLGGDVRPIFAGSVSFVDDSAVQKGVSDALASVAPTINKAIQMWVGRVQTALGFTTTPQPGSALSPNGTRTNPSNPSNPPNLSYGGGSGQLGEPLSLQQYQQLQSQNQQEQTAPGYGALSGTYNYRTPRTTTTVEPLPIIRFKPAEDEDENDQLSNSQKVQ